VERRTGRELAKIRDSRQSAGTELLLVQRRMGCRGYHTHSRHERHHGDEPMKASPCKRFRDAFLVTVILGVAGCNRAPTPTAKVAVSNSYLGSAVSDLMGTEVPVLALAEPGTCPGHFDLRPSQVESLRACKLVECFDFQRGLDQAAAVPGGAQAVTISVPEGMCVPQSYFAVCEQTASALEKARLISHATAGTKLQAIEQRMAVNSAWAANRLGDHYPAKVIANEHQADFCRRFGLPVIATFSAADTATFEQINRVLQDSQGAGRLIVIANKAEGAIVAQALADQLGAKLVVLDNFPEPEDGSPGFDALFRRNIDALALAVGR